jgi:DNA (cytosine-5)-methyltransferase 1
MLNGVKLRDAAKKIGVSYNTLTRWLEEGKVEDVGRNRNDWRIFTDEDIARISAFANTVKYTEQQNAKGKGSGTVEKSGYKVASFFAGIGGFDIGFEQAGFETTFQCEVEPFCQSILKQHWPDVPKWGDITTLKNATIPVSDVWVGGFPCQDLSLARMGQRDGLRGTKSRLFHEFAGLVRESKPRVLVLENVAGLLSSHGGQDFAVLLQTLAELGYSLGWRTFNSRYFGVPQSRQRVYIVGCLGDRRGPGAILFEPERSAWSAKESGQNGKKPASTLPAIVGDISGDGPVIQAVAYCLYATSARHTGTDWSRNYACYPKSGRIRRLTPSECEGVMAFPPAWTRLNELHLDQEQLDSARYHALGNAVTPPVANWLARRIRTYLEAVDASKQPKGATATARTTTAVKAKAKPAKSAKEMSLSL